MVDEGLFTSLDWHEQSLKYKPLPRTLGILWILVERMKIMVETKEEHDEDKDTTEMDEDKKALTTESKSIWN